MKNKVCKSNVSGLQGNRVMFKTKITKAFIKLTGSLKIEMA